jgi:hypothetical protein
VKSSHLCTPCTYIDFDALVESTDAHVLPQTGIRYNAHFDLVNSSVAKRHYDDSSPRLGKQDKRVCSLNSREASNPGVRGCQPMLEDFCPTVGWQV